MNELIQKLSSYNLFNYLLPGIVFAVLAKHLFLFNIVQENIFEGIFIYYFVGLIISRIGSLTIEPFLKMLKVIKFVDYKKYAEAAKLDDKIELMSEINNMYRTIISVFTCLILIKLYKIIETEFQLNETVKIWIVVIMLLFIFISSYKKQTEYVVKRVNIV